MSDKGSKCNRRGRTIKKPKKYCTTDSDKPTSKKKAKSKILEEMTAMFSNSNSEESTDTPSQLSDNESNFSTESENNVEMKKGSEKNEQSVRKEKGNQDKPAAKPDQKKEGNQEKTLKPTSEQQLEHHGNNNLNSPGYSTQTLQNNYDQGDDMMRTSNNHSVYDFNSGAVVETSNYFCIPKTNILFYLSVKVVLVRNKKGLTNKKNTIIYVN